MLGEHRHILRQAFGAHGGVEVDTQGDSFFFAFPSANDAIAAAAQAQAALQDGPLRVRMGLHTGEAMVTAEGYVGVEVHRAARIAGAGHGGQVVFSETTRRLLPDDLSVRDLGLHRLKDLIGAEHLYQLGEENFPALRTIDATNLPNAANRLIGRDREVEELVSVLTGDTRLLTITGPGGTGKTRLSLQVAAELVGSFKDGVFWVPLAGLSDPDLLASEIAKTIGAPDDLTGYLRGKAMLIVLDNFEHLLDAAPALSALLTATRQLRVLVTSRAPLHLAGERDFRLDPLSMSDAAALFVERAGAVGRSLKPDSTVESICRRLDGLPLAVELAAARTRVLSPEALRERLDSVLPLLTGGPSDAPQRQRTLRATIEWSYDLLDAPGRELLARVAVFVGGFPIAGAEEVCGADLDGLERLVDSSLLKTVGDDRFLMLETIRDYALERLEASTEAGSLRERHAAYFSDLADQAHRHRFDAEAEWSERLDADHDDLRAALDWMAGNDPGGAIATAGALGWFWFSHGHLIEGKQRLAEALTFPGGADAARARALSASGALTARCGETEDGLALLTAAISLWRELGDGTELASALCDLGWLFVYDTGDFPAALDSFEQSLDLSRDLADPGGETRALVGVCQSLVALGEVERAESMSRDLLARSGDDPRTEHFAHHFLADCALMRGDVGEAERRYEESLRAALAIGDVLESSFEVQGVAMASSARDPERALRLAGAVEALWESLGTSFSVAFWDDLLDRYIGAAWAGVGSRAEEAWAEGRAMAFDDAVTMALGAGGASALAQTNRAI